MCVLGNVPFELEAWAAQDGFFLVDILFVSRIVIHFLGAYQWRCESFAHHKTIRPLSDCLHGSCHPN